jgi:FlaA1/EpsC-like NDP-sugar epimerase
MNATNGNQPREGKRRVLLIGAGSAGKLAAKEIRKRADMNLEIIGFVDDDPQKFGAVIQQIKVLGNTKDLPRLVSELNIDHVIITIAATSRQEFKRIMKSCEQIPIKVQVIPSVYEILQELVQITRIRDVQIEDLLGRDPVELDTEEIEKFLAGKTVMITGAGGSIGSELARQVARCKPARVLLVERTEGALFNIEQEMRAEYHTCSFIPLLADVRDETRMRSIFGTFHPQAIFHAAAHKHVPLVELNVIEAVNNNVFATLSLGNLAGEFGAEVVVMISTDKAVRPTSVMGATKRIAELVVQDLNRQFATRYVAVRFGNVIGSTGSVIPIFRDQIRKGGPITVTHPEMVRYFMTIPEAVQLVMQAGAMGAGGEIFILNMGEPVKILELAKALITLSGLKPSEDIEIVFTKPRPGEKLREELEITEEGMSKTQHPKIFIGKLAAYPEEKVGRILKRLASLAQSGEETEIRRFIGEVLPEAQLDPKPVAAGNVSTLPEAVQPDLPGYADSKWDDPPQTELVSV